MKASHSLRGIAAAVLVLAVLAAPATAKDWKTVTIATEGAYPPWNMQDAQGKIIGFEPDLADYLCAHMHVTCKMIATDWDGVIPGLTAGKYDAIMDGMSVTPKRLQVIDFTRPYAQSPTSLAAMKSSPLATLPEKAQRIDFAKDDTCRGELGQWSRRILGLRPSVIRAGFEKLRGSPDISVGKLEECFPIGVHDQVFLTDGAPETGCVG